MNFEQAIEHVLGSEGGYVNDPDDAGGETNWGISKRSYPNVDIRHLTREGAIAIYRRDFWQAARCDFLPEDFRLVYFDHAVNAGVGAAIRLLQECVGVVVDGMIGPNTMAGIGRIPPARLREDYLWLRARHYARLARDKSSQQKFLPGWILRLISVRLAK